MATIPTTPETNPFSLKHYSTGTRKIASFGLSLFIIGLIIASIWAPRYWALSTLCSGAFTALGWGIGFLFGVPRTAATDTRSNTNLEQISDWLTKVLVGVGLTQLQKIPTKLALLAGYIAKDYGQSGSPVFALSMILYFSALGFLTGYLLTRLALQQEFERTDIPAVNVRTTPTEIKVGQPADTSDTDKQSVEVKTGVTEVKVGPTDASRIMGPRATTDTNGVEKVLSSGTMDQIDQTGEEKEDKQ